MAEKKRAKEEIAALTVHLELFFQPREVKLRFGKLEGINFQKKIFKLLFNSFDDECALRIQLFSLAVICTLMNFDDVHSDEELVEIKVVQLRFRYASKNLQMISVSGIVFEQKPVSGEVVKFIDRENETDTVFNGRVGS